MRDNKFIKIGGSTTLAEVMPPSMNGNNYITKCQGQMNEISTLH